MADEEYPHEFNNWDHGTVNHSALFSLFPPIAYSITCVLGLIGNLLIIIVFVFYEKIKTLTDTFLINLAIADVLFLSTLPFLAYESAHSWVFGIFLCKTIRSTYRVNLYTSMLTLTAITFHRFISITRVTKASKYQVSRPRWRYVVCGLLWVLALVLAIPQFIYSHVSEGHCFEIYEPAIMELVVVSLQMVVGFALPFISMIFSYTFILGTLVNGRGVQKKKSMKIIVAIVVVFIATQLPYNALVLALAINKGLISSTFFIRLSIVMEAVAYLHASLNPVLYFFVGTKFRKYFWKIMRGLGLKRRVEETTDHLRGTDGDSKNVSASTNLFVTNV